MRVIECNVCGDAVTAADDRELAGHLGAHLREQHGGRPTEEELAAAIAEQAYDATDS